MKQFDHMIERKLNLELSNVFPRLSNVFPRLKFLAGCGQFSDFSNIKIQVGDYHFYIVARQTMYRNMETLIHHQTECWLPPAPLNLLTI